MAFYPDAWLEELKTRNSIVEVISETVQLKNAGSGYMGLCPFHREKTPSFHVEPYRQIYKCFGCGAGGDVVTFVMQRDGLEFMEAVAYLAQRANMSLPDVDDREYRRDRQKKDTLYALLTEAARYFRDILFSPEGREGMEYLKSRGLSAHTIKSFGLGYASDSWDALLNHLKGKGYDDMAVVEAGLAIKREGKAPYDRFRKRVIYPIIDPNGRVVAFGGRVMDPDAKTAKYLNSSDSPVFHKSQVLYGLNLVRKEMPVANIIVVEGYMDAISLHQYGFKTAVASMGTSLTREQCQLIKRYLPTDGNVYIAYDGDSAGQSATLRGLKLLSDTGCRVRVVQFAGGKDPDEVLRKNGELSFKKNLEAAISLTEYRVEAIRRNFDLTLPESMARFTSEATKIISELESPVERDVYLGRLEKSTGFSKDLLRQEVAKCLKTANNAHEKADKRVNPVITGNNRKGFQPGHSGGVPQRAVNTDEVLEANMIRILCSNARQAQRITGLLEPEDFTIPWIKNAYEAVKALVEERGDIGRDGVLNRIYDLEYRQKLFRLLDQNYDVGDAERFAGDLLNKFEIRKKLLILKEISKKIHELEQENDIDAENYAILQKQQIQLTQELREKGFMRTFG